MDYRTGIIMVGAFFGGAATGAAISYIFTKQYYERVAQNAIDEVKQSYKDEIKQLKEQNNEPKDGDKEREVSEQNEADAVVKKDKPSISEMSSIVAGYDTDSSERTRYNRTSDNHVYKDLKDELKAVIRKAQKCFNYEDYMNLEDIDYPETVFKLQDETWYDWQDVEYEVEDLPFDPALVKWEDDQCYIVDSENHEVYELQKV